MSEGDSFTGSGVRVKESPRDSDGKASPPGMRQGLCLFRGQLRERECEAELRGTHSQAELGNDIGLMGALLGLF